MRNASVTSACARDTRGGTVAKRYGCVSAKPDCGHLHVCFAARSLILNLRNRRNLWILLVSRPEGKLTSEEREEYETSIRFANYLAILQAKARKLLQDDEPFFRLPSPKGQFMRLQSQRRLETGVDFR